MFRAFRLSILTLTVIICTFSAQAQTYQTLYAFTRPGDGSTPFATVIRDQTGFLYGTTFQGGPGGACAPIGCGEVYRVNPTTGQKVLFHAFADTDGKFPRGVLLRDNNGSLFGTASTGGSSGSGVVFKIDSAGTYTVLHNFTGGTDGGLAYSGLIHDAAGNLYGTTLMGGTFNAGVIYRINTAGNFKVLYNFNKSVDGGSPSAALFRDSAGNLYGTTSSAGVGTAGTVFKIAPTGQYTVLYSFTGGSDGGNPDSGLLRDPAGNLYGIAPVAGDLSCAAPSGCGVAFKIDNTGHFSVLHTFTGTPDGRLPEGRLTRDAAGNLYGTTLGGGTEDRGTIFKIDAVGNYSVIHSFQVSLGEGYEGTGVILDNLGNLYGATMGGPCCGTVFKFTP